MLFYFYFYAITIVVCLYFILQWECKAHWSTCVVLIVLKMTLI